MDTILNHPLAIVIVALVSAALGAGGITPLVVAYLHSRRQGVLDTHEFAKATFMRMEERIALLEVSEKECMKAKEELTLEVGTLRAEISSLQARIADAFPEEPAMVSSDTSGIITSWNEGAERVFGWRSDEMIGKPIEMLMPPYARGAHRVAFLRTVEGKVELRNVKLRNTYALTRWGNKPVTIVLNTSTDDKGVRHFDAEIHVVPLHQ